MTSKLQRLTELMAQRDMNAIALVPGANLFYLTGLQMHTSERITLALITRQGEVYLLLPALEVARAESRLQVPVRFYPWTDAEGSGAAWNNLNCHLSFGGESIGVEYTAMRVLELKQLQNFAPRARIADAGQVLSDLRVVKEADEIDAMRRAARVIDASLEDLLCEIKPGMTEKQIAAMWQLKMREHGADTIPDEPIVASGPNSAAPHTSATRRAIEHGDLVVLDGWCRVDGYYTDITRTVAVGQVSDELRTIYDVTLRANEAGRQTVAPGVVCEQVDRAARDLIASEGFGEYFLHRTGHGLGLEVHEPPYLVQGYTVPLAPGMTFTVEPGIYLAGRGGVRIEDDVLVTPQGAETLTRIGRELLLL